MARTLASIQRITDIQPIEGADAIDVASVLGWKVVVKKGEFEVGDLAVYLEIDSVPPDEEQYRFLWKWAEQRPNNFRIKTVKLRGQISQGILFPLSAFPDQEAWFSSEPSDWPVEGDDVTEALGVTKYEPPAPLGDEQEGQFFDGVPKTDEERVQSSTGRQHLEALQGRPYYITVKCDGASMTVAMHDGVPKVASRNFRLRDLPDSAYWRAARASNLLAFVELFPHMAVQGELVGPGIQGNRLGLSEHRCLVFNVYNRDLDLYLPFDVVADIAQEFEFDTVPLLEFGLSFNYSADDLLDLAEGKYDGTKNEREGIVIRNDDDGPFTSFKAISNRFLLKGGD